MIVVGDKRISVAEGWAMIVNSWEHDVQSS